MDKIHQNCYEIKLKNIDSNICDGYIMEEYMMSYQL